MGKLTKANSYFKTALKHAIRINNKNRIAIAEYNMGKIYLDFNNIDSALTYLNRSYKKSIENNYSINPAAINRYN